MDKYSADRLRLLDDWGYLEKQVPEGARSVAWIAEQTGYPFKRVDFVRHVRNRCAHGDPVDREQLDAARQVVGELRAKFADAAVPRPNRSARLQGDPLTTLVIGPSSIAGWTDVRCKGCATVTSMPNGVSLSCPGCGRRLQIF